jgi:hypothetical protein
MADDWESFYEAGNPNSDADKDGLTNRQEYDLGSSPIDTDTDGDGLPDAWEVRYGLDPLEVDGTDGASGDLR